jgi:hypothetical protein
VLDDRSREFDDEHNQHLLDLQNRIVTIFAGALIKPGLKPDAYSEGKGITHVNMLRTIEAMYGLPKSGAQQPNAAAAGNSDESRHRCLRACRIARVGPAKTKAAPSNVRRLPGALARQQQLHTLGVTTRFMA